MADTPPRHPRPDRPGERPGSRPGNRPGARPGRDPAPTFHDEEKAGRSRLVSLLVETRSIMPSGGATGLPLVLAIAAMCFLASLTLGAALSVGHAASEWTGQLSGALTVEIKPSPEMKPEKQLSEVMSLLDQTNGIVSARPVTRDETAKLLEPWLGKGNVTDDLPIPQLVDVEIDPASPPDLAALAINVAAVAPGALLDTHRQWQAEIISAAHAVLWLAYAVLGLVAATTTAIVVFATRAGLSANRDVVEVLHLIGARDRFIAREVQHHFLHLGLRGGIAGLTLSVLTFVVLSFAGDNGALFLMPVTGLQLNHYPILLAVPFASALVAVLTARITVMRELEHML